MSESFGGVWVTSTIAALMASAEPGSTEVASSSAIALTSLSVSWLPSSAKSGM